MLITSDEVNILNTFRVMIILRLLLLLTNLHLKLLCTQGTAADKLLSTQRVNDKCILSLYFSMLHVVLLSYISLTILYTSIISPHVLL